ncbi:NSFL1 cofactor p47-like isoform X5 [Narcine bancroftii]|uniref:NSFL1 cofactor p47-like isoform X5 n=1 Tax=Narcine bancroftii TaxID=1343680 RepID=UPI0038319926
MAEGAEREERLPGVAGAGGRLEAAGWDVQLALTSFCEEGTDEPVQDVPTFNKATNFRPANRSTSYQETTLSGSRQSPSGKEIFCCYLVRPISGTSRISSLKDLKNEQSNSSTDKGERFYAGGSEHSGQQIVEPSKKKNLNEIVDDLFKGAKEHGAVPVDHWTESVGEANRAVPFAGGGYRLGVSSQELSEYVSQDQKNESNLDVQILLKLWKNGFSLDDGELRTYTDPKNAEFLESIGRGPTPTIVSTPSSPEEEFKYFVNVLNVNESEPTTNVQIRLADGSRLVQKFNQTHRISDIRQFIIQNHPVFATSSFILMTTFPNKELTDEEQTLQEAKLLNAVIVQRLK